MPSTSNLPVPPRRSNLAHYNPGKGLEAIATAEIAESHFTRAKDASGLFKAIEAKITAQAEYVVWRDSVARPAHRPNKSFSAETVLPAADPGDVAAHRWRKRLCTKSEAGTVIDAAKVAAALDEAQQRCLRFCEATDTYAKAFFTGEFEQYTPAIYVEAAREVLGAIDLDPASCEFAQQTVRATRYFTVETDGLKQEWHGRVWLNPPYHRALAPAFVAKLVEEFRAGRTTAAIMLTNNGTDTNWFRDAHAESNAVCFTHGRINFTRPGGAEVFPTQGQAFSYFGDDIETFWRVFANVGPVLVPYEKARTVTVRKADNPAAIGR